METFLVLSTFILAYPFIYIPLCIIAILLMGSAVDERKLGFAWVTFIFLLYVFFPPIASFFTNSNAITITLMVAVYIPIGAFWSLFKWNRHVDEVVQSIKDAYYKVGPKRRVQLDYVCPSGIVIFDKLDVYTQRNLNPIEFKGTLISWMVFWVPSVLFTAWEFAIKDVWSRMLGWYNQCVTNKLSSVRLMTDDRSNTNQHH